MPSTWNPIWIFLIFAISADVAVLGSTLATEQVKPLKVHSEVVWLMPLRLHPMHHRFYRVLMHDHRVVRHERPNTDGIINGHEGLHAGTEGSIVLLTKIVRAEVRAFIDQVASNIDVAEVRGGHERCDAVAVGVIHV